MAALEQVIAGNPGKLADVARYARRWQRLGERLHLPLCRGEGALAPEMAEGREERVHQRRRFAVRFPV
jgi:hypothetical protein